MPRIRRATPGSLGARDLAPILRGLRRANTIVGRAFPGEPEDRQPVHTVYGGAHLFRADSAQKLGALGLAALERVRARRAQPSRGARLRGSRGGPDRFRPDRPRPHRRETSARAGGRLPHRFRGRLRQPTRCRGRRPCTIRGGAGCRRCRGRHAAALHRHPHQAACRTSCMRAACARSISSSPRWRAPVAGACRPGFVVTVPKIMLSRRRSRLSPAPARRSSGG